MAKNQDYSPPMGDLPARFDVGHRLKAEEMTAIVRHLQRAVNLDAGPGSRALKPVTRIRNDTGAKIERWDVLEIYEYVQGAKNDLVGAARVPTVSGSKTACVAAVPISEDMTGMAYTFGECMALSDASASRGETVGTLAGTKKLATGVGGNFLWIDAASIDGVDYGYVRFVGATQEETSSSSSSTSAEAPPPESSSSGRSSSSSSSSSSEDPRWVTVVTDIRYDSPNLQMRTQDIYVQDQRPETAWTTWATAELCPTEDSSSSSGG